MVYSPQFAEVNPINRRKFLQTLGLGALGMAIPMPVFSTPYNPKPMGIVVHSYGARWNSKVKSEQYPGFENAIQLMRHCHKIGAGGVQVGIHNWASDFVKKVRDEREKLGLYMEGSVSLPQSISDVSDFEKQIINAKEAGMTVVRTVCLSGRRYENLKSLAEFEKFKEEALASLQLAEPVVHKHRVKLGVENHKDWLASELVAIIQKIDSPWIGVTLDFGNNISLLENPEEVIALLAPYAFSTHIKDMGVQAYENGFLLSEVPLGKGIIDLRAGIDLCRKYNPDITFNLEMITRDPLQIPCLEENYYATFNDRPATALANTLRMVQKHQYIGELPATQQLDAEQRLAFEEKNVVECLVYGRESLKLSS